MLASTFISPLHRLVLAHVIQGRSEAEIAKRIGWRESFVRQRVDELVNHQDNLPLFRVLQAMPRANKSELYALANAHTGPVKDPTQERLFSYALTHFSPNRLAKLKSPYALIGDLVPPYKKLCVAMAQAKTWGLSGREITQIYGGDSQLRGIWDYHGIWLQRTSPLATALNYVDSCMGKAEEEWLASIPLTVRTTRRRNARVSEEEFLTARVSAKGRKLSAERVAVDLGMSIRRPNRIFSRIAASTGIPAHHILIPVIFYIRSR